MQSSTVTTSAAGSKRKGQGDTRERILDVAEELLQQRGFNGFSYQHIAERLGIKTAAVHYHFRAKADLGKALIDRHVADLEAWATRLDRRGLSAIEKVDAYLAFTRAFLEQGHRICVSGALQSELPALPEELVEPVQGMVWMHRRWLQQLLERGRAAGELAFEGDVGDRTLVTMAAVQGALQVGRTCGIEWFDAAVRQIRADLVG